jgi:ABC-type taurine transport system substrate-binding protein
VRTHKGTDEGIVETLKLSQYPQAKKANPDHFLDGSIVKTLEDQGFLRQIGLRRLSWYLVNVKDKGPTGAT